MICEIRLRPLQAKVFKILLHYGNEMHLFRDCLSPFLSEIFFVHFRWLMNWRKLKEKCNHLTPIFVSFLQEMLRCFTILFLLPGTIVQDTIVATVASINIFLGRGLHISNQSFTFALNFGPSWKAWEFTQLHLKSLLRAWNWLLYPTNTIQSL